MRNITRSTRAEIAHSDITWFATWLLQEATETAPTRENITRLILDATKELREIRKSYEPARPLLRRGV